LQSGEKDIVESFAVVVVDAPITEAITDAASEVTIEIVRKVHLVVESFLLQQQIELLRNDVCWRAA
jgi:hypothetical protein